MSRVPKFIILVLLIVSLAGAISAQTKKNSKPVKPVPAVAETPNPTPEPTPAEPKQNKRPGSAAPAKTPVSTPTYFYQFERPGFAYSKLLIEHDDAGKGKISFQKDGYDELFTDPIALSAVTLKNINDALFALDFLDSTENYQYERDYSHMGNVTLTIKKGTRERTTKYNWTENKNAKVLMDEYRRISNEYTWRFEIDLARQNQPLLTPGLVDALDSYLKRSEISDPPHFVSYLTTLSTDEHLPLMARNHLTKLIKGIEKTQSGNR
ncbi:hypothetical protein BH10ACI3_BH10ACI3_20200 [soil metagenome]